VLGAVDVEGEAEALEVVEHHLGVVGKEDVGEGAGTFGKRGEDEGAVGQALGTGWGEGDLEGVVDGGNSELVHLGKSKIQKPKSRESPKKTFKSESDPGRLSTLRARRGLAIWG